MENELYTVTRQSQWPGGQKVVEISRGGLDYTNPDALAAKYDGEFEEFNDPRKAVKTAIRIARQWKKDQPKENIRVAVGNTGGYTCPFEPISREKLIKWANSEYESLSKCDRCGKIIEGPGYSLYENDGMFCSTQCAEANYNDFLTEVEELPCRA